MNSIPESWIQNVVKAAGLPPASPEVVNAILPTIELQIRKIIQQAVKFQKRSKSSTLKVDDINLALTTNKLEPVYGLHMWHSGNLLANGEKQSSNEYTSYVNISDFANIPIPDTPLKTVLSLHWLAVNGTQPLISENPSIVQLDIENQPTNLPKELQYLYARITGILINAGNNKSLDTVYAVLKEDRGLQELVPFFSRFFYMQIKANTRNLKLLKTLTQAIQSLNQNTAVNLEAHIQQLLPAVFTCIVAGKLSSSHEEDHWTLRQYASGIIASLCNKYISVFPDLHARICKTYLEALSPDKSLVTIYGGIVGIGALGHTVVRALLLNKLEGFKTVLENEEREILALSNNDNMEVEEHQKKRTKALLQEKQLAVSKCKEAIQSTLGRYITTCMQLPTVPWKSSQQSQAQERTTKESVELCDMEESLVPYYATLSKELYHSRMMI